MGWFGERGAARAGVAMTAVQLGVVLLLGMAGCFNRQNSDAQAAATDSSGGSQSSKAGLVRTSWSGTHTEPVKDPGLNETAFTVTVPNGWKYVGTILRPGGCHAPALPADGLSWTALSPDGVSAVGQMPGSSWMWESDGSNPTGPKCPAIDITTANAYLLNVAVPNVHPDATHIEVEPLQANELQVLAHQKEQDANAPPTFGMKVKHLLDFGRVRLQYTENGRVVDEQLGVMLMCQEVPSPGLRVQRGPPPTHRNCAVHGIFFTRAPHGHLDEVIAGKLPFAQIDHQWDHDVSQQMGQAFAQMQKASDAVFAAHMKQAQDQTDQMRANGRAFQENLKSETDNALAADRQNQAAIDHAAHRQVNISLDRQDFIDPNTGQRITTSDQYMHNWIGSDGTVVLNNNNTFDPNGVVNPVRESFTELIPVN
jgi:hypothetical protein